MIDDFRIRQALFVMILRLATAEMIFGWIGIVAIFFRVVFSPKLPPCPPQQAAIKLR